MVRDRLAELRAGHSEDDESEEALLEDGFMDTFFGEVEELRGMVEEIERGTEQVKRVQSEILSSPKTDEKMQQELDELKLEITKAINQVRSKLKLIEQNIEEAEQHSSSPADVRIRKTQRATLSRKFVEVMAEYNKSQTDYREKCNEKIKRQGELARIRVGEEELERLLDEGKVAGMTHGMVTDTQIARNRIADIEARHAEIIKLEKSLSELHDMFVDMAVLVESQGEMVDRIEYQVDQAVDYVDRANTDMKKARDYENKARKKRLMILACLLVTCTVMASTIASYFGLK